jgi:tetratricopeptide (TPR) repeat protein
LTPRLLSKTAPARTQARAPIDPDAYQKYLLARSMLEERTNDGDTSASRLFKEVTDVEPDFAPAYAGLGRTYVHMAQFHAQRVDILASAEASLNTALRLDPRNLEAMSEHLVLAVMDWNWEQADRDVRDLQALSPHSAFTVRALAIYYGGLGFQEQQSAAMREATRLDPLSFVDLNSLAVVYANRGEYVEAASAALDALALRPDRPLALSTLCSAYVGMKRTKDAQGLIARLLALHEPDASRGCALMLAASAGRMADAHAMADTIAGRFPTFVYSETDIGIFYLAADDAAKALAWFERAYDKHDYGLFAVTRFATTPAAFLRSPGWVSLMRRPEAKAWQAAHDRLAAQLSPTN